VHGDRFATLDLTDSPRQDPVDLLLAPDEELDGHRLPRIERALALLGHDPES
jgi:hypothetical protein